MADKTKQVAQLTDTLAERDGQIERLKKEIEKNARRLNEMEIRCDEMDIKKRSIEKQQQVQNK